jgi:hypothetical protein
MACATALAVGPERRKAVGREEADFASDCKHWIWGIDCTALGDGNGPGQEKGQETFSRPSSPIFSS